MTEYDIEKLTPEIVAEWKSSLYDINHRLVKLAKVDDGKHIARLIALGFDINHCGTNRATPLFSLCHAPAPVVREMLANGAKVDLRNRFGETPLFMCVQHNKAENVKLLLSAGAKINERGQLDRTPLMEAVSSAALAVAEVLLEAGADLEAKGKKGETALFMAVQRLAFGFSRKEKEDDVWKILELLLRKGADVNCRDILGNTPLMAAMRADNVRLAALLKNYGAEVNAVNYAGDSVLMQVCQNPRGSVESRKQSIEKLLFWGADPSLKNDDGWTAGNYLAVNPLMKDDKGIFEERLMRAQELPDIRQTLENLTTEQVAVWKKSLHDINRRFIKLARFDGGRYLDKLLACGFDINHQDFLGNTPLFLLHNDAPLTEKFIAAGADVNVLNKYGQSVLEDALFDKTTDRLALLLKHGADVDVQDVQGRTVLHVAAERANLPALKLLVAAGADINLRDGLGKTPLLAAVFQNEDNPYLDGDIVEAVCFLLENGADIHAVGGMKEGVILCAATFANVRLLKLLLAYGADVNRRNCHGWTALMTAVSINLNKERREEFMRILLEAGADVAAEDDDGKSVKTIMQKSPIFKDSALLQRL